MQTPDSQIIVARFFEAIHKLTEYKIIRGKKTFTERYNINRWNFNTLEKDTSRDIFQVAWLNILVQDYKISAQWLLTGEGSFFAFGWDANMVKKIAQESVKNATSLQNVCKLNKQHL